MEILQMKVFKFGGGILDSAEAVRQIPDIIGMFPGEPLLIVVSAFGKTTNALEELVFSTFKNHDDKEDLYRKVISSQKTIFDGLFPDQDSPAHHRFMELAAGLGKAIREIPAEMASHFNAFYDHLICYGELFSTIAVHFYLEEYGTPNRWVDVRTVLKTDRNYRDAAVEWELSAELARRQIIPYLQSSPSQVIVTQGFIGSDATGNSTSLGREGSDYTASVFASLLDAGSVIIWKDVPGILNADPKHFRQTIKLDELSYAEATELAYYGAKVIHPKTVKPLQNKGIPLEVRSFFHPAETGTLIHAQAPAEQFIPSFIFKNDQVLISISNRDLSFVHEKMFSGVFELLSRHSIHMNLIQNSALTLTFCIDNHPMINEMIDELGENYVVRYNTGLELITIRHYNDKAAEHVLQGREILLEQQNRTVVQYVIR